MEEVTLTKVGKDWRIHFAVRALVFYSNTGGIVNGLHRPPHRTLDALLPGNVSAYDRLYPVDPAIRKRVVLACLTLCPASGISTFHNYSCFALLEHFDSTDQVKILTILETYYGLGK